MIGGTAGIVFQGILLQDGSALCGSVQNFVCGHAGSVWGWFWPFAPVGIFLGKNVLG